MCPVGRYVLCDEDMRTGAVTQPYSWNDRGRAIRYFRYEAKHGTAGYHRLYILDQRFGIVIARSGDWWWKPVNVLIDPWKEKDILARMVARLNGKEGRNARLDAVCDLIELGHTEPESWKLVWDEMPVEAADAEAERVTKLHDLIGDKP